MMMFPFGLLQIIICSFSSGGYLGNISPLTFYSHIFKKNNSLNPRLPVSAFDKSGIKTNYHTSDI